MEGVTREEGIAARDAIFKPVLEAEGITDDYLAKKLKAELEAEKTEFAKFEGKITDTIQVVAWEIRQRARQDAHKLRGDYPAEKKDLGFLGKDGQRVDPPNVTNLELAAKIAYYVELAMRRKAEQGQDGGTPE